MLNFSPRWARHTSWVRGRWPPQWRRGPAGPPQAQQHVASCATAAARHHLWSSRPAGAAAAQVGDSHAPSGVCVCPASATCDRYGLGSSAGTQIQRLMREERWCKAVTMVYFIVLSYKLQSCNSSWVNLEISWLSKFDFQLIKTVEKKMVSVIINKTGPSSTYSLLLESQELHLLLQQWDVLHKFFNLGKYQNGSYLVRTS